jgi:hypothetical protein
VSWSPVWSAPNCGRLHTGSWLFAKRAAESLTEVLRAGHADAVWAILRPVLDGLFAEPVSGGPDLAAVAAAAAEAADVRDDLPFLDAAARRSRGRLSAEAARLRRTLRPG